ncbi:hypothetical protein TeGR_g10554 [Tetraparma gracilis]|uniref:Chitinase n=1 Tax=Tetraparma gracilis TaxID=2962635 RepID=A0ABQ6MPB1_9STRA|nr:hypothetical protein TeGR_g10554 [Tetraparma gracilis]
MMACKVLLLALALPLSVAVTLPDKLLVAYQSWSECDDSVIEVVEAGVNVVIWFATNLHSGPDGGALMSGGPNRTCVEEKVATLSSMGYTRDKVKHLISVGGWDAPHPETNHSAAEYKDAFIAFSDGLYDGLDWDLEGNDALASSNNFFSAECLRLMGELSKLLHDDGLIVSMAPPESYLDIQTAEFSKFVNLTYPDDDWNTDPVFSYHGHNTYAVPLAMYPDAFDFVSVQIYETKSHASYNTSVLGTPQQEYLATYMTSLVTEGINVDFSSDPDFSYLGMVTIDLSEKAVVGLISNGGMGGPITAKNATAAYAQLEAGHAPRGFMYWCIGDDKDAALPLELASILAGPQNSLADIM